MVKTNVKFKISIYVGVLLLIVVFGVAFLQISASQAFVPSTDKEVIGEGIVVIRSLDNSQIKLINQVDGYSVILPAELQVVDTSSTDIRIVLEDKHRVLEIYKQPIYSGISANVYISYSNRFLQNAVDHKMEYFAKVDINGYPAVIHQWSRKKLSKVENDKNYYACIDIIEKDYVYTFFIKSDVPFYITGGYMNLLDSFSTFAPSANPTSLKIKQTENSLWDTETKAFYEKYFSSDSDLTWGIFEYSAPETFGILDSLENKLDYNFEFLLVYKSIQKTYPTNYVKDTLERAYDRGRTVELTLQTTSQDAGEGNMVYDILDGKYDSFLKSFAAETAEFGHSVLFRFCNEMNGDWCEYSGYHTSRDPHLFKELYKYVYRIFEEAKADNVIWVWNPNEKSFPNFKWNSEIMYYPGDEYVDIVGLTGYNNGTYYQGETWRSFTEIYDPLYQRMASISEKPLMITEFSSSSIGGNKEEWVKNMFANIYKYPKIKVAIWWNGCDWDTQGNIARPYFINETEGLVDIFRQNLQHYKKPVK